MPRVPGYDEFQVAPRSPGAPRAESAASASLLGAGAADTEALGKGMLAAGNAAGDIVARMQDVQNADKLFQAETALKNDWAAFDTQMRSKKGAAALADGGVTKQTEDWFGKTNERYGNLLENDTQRKLFEQQVQKLRSQGLDVMSKHQATEQRVSLVESATATIGSSVNNAAANANDWTVTEAEAKNIRQRVGVLAGLEGWTPERRAAEEGKHLTTLHAQVIQQLAKNGGPAAEAYYKKYESEIDGAKRAEIGEFARKATATSIGDSTADTVFKALGPKSSTEPVELLKMEEELRKQLKGNDDAIKVGIAGLRERVAAYRDQRKEQEGARMASVNTLILQGASASSIRKSVEFLQLAPDDALKVSTFLENREYQRAARDAALAQRGVAEDQRREYRLTSQGMERWMQLQDPAELMKLDRNGVINLLTTLGARHTQDLLERHDKYKANEQKFIEAKIDNEDFNATALKFGLQPNEKSKSEREKDDLIRLRSEVETRIDLAQRGAGNKPLPREQKVKIMQEVIGDKVLQDTYFGYRHSEATAATRTAPEMKDAYTVVDGKRVYTRDIDPTWRADIVKQLGMIGAPISEKDIATRWLKRQAALKEKK